MMQRSKRLCRVVFQPTGLRVEVQSGSTVLDAARAVELPLSSDCGGNGTCGRCIVYPFSVEIPPATDDELSSMGSCLVADGARLACCVEITGDMEVEIPEDSLLSSQVLEINSTVSKIELDEKPALSAGLHPLGMAVDLGSTKIAAYLMDLVTGQELASGGAMNPQISYGEDVVSRLTFACTTDDGLNKLGEVVRRGIAELAQNLLAELGLAGERVREVCIVGNTVMTHFLLGLPVDTLAVAPFKPATLARLETIASGLGLDFAEDAMVVVPPAIGGFVGSDHVAMILGADIDQSRVPCLGFDIGTNTEIVLCNPSGRLLAATSCASGPAFEGAHIKHGMRAGPGAISKVSFDGHRPFVETISEKPPLGICGSGIIDAIAGMLDAGILGANGHLNREAPGVRMGENGYEFLLQPAAKCAGGRDIAVTQGDVSEIQLAKAAIHAAAETLLEELSMGPEEIVEVHFAGAFGSRFNIESVLRIGLFPVSGNPEFRQIGNAAGAGAKRILLSKRDARRAKEIACRTRFVDLKDNSSFNKRMAKALRFPGCENKA